MRTIREIFRDAAVLDADGRHTNGSDKESNHHYGDAYEKIIGFPLRCGASLIMEVGIADGSSLLAWREVFPFAHCVGLDIHPSVNAHGERIEFHLGDAANQFVCKRAAAGRQFDFICEDASHRASDSMLTLLYLWPHVKPGGIYVIEEFYNILELRNEVTTLLPCAEVVDTIGPSGGIEPLVVLRKPLYGPSPLRDAYEAWADQIS
jgi:hypothetical protein